MAECLGVYAYSRTEPATEAHRVLCFFFFFQAEDGIRDLTVTGVQTCALPISSRRHTRFDCDWSSDVCSSDTSRRRHTRFESDCNYKLCYYAITPLRTLV